MIDGILQDISALRFNHVSQKINPKPLKCLKPSNVSEFWKLNFFNDSKIFYSMYVLTWLCVCTMKYSGIISSCVYWFLEVVFYVFILFDCLGKAPFRLDNVYGCYMNWTKFRLWFCASLYSCKLIIANRWSDSLMDKLNPFLKYINSHFFRKVKNKLLYQLTIIHFYYSHWLNSPLQIQMNFLISNFQANFTDWRLRYLLRITLRLTLTGY